ncbi:MAG TPA: phosphopantetheine-binding protein [Roseiarcus sp.]|nr:phosphopantetheine-binding protein [Roseiarcus sp.]
MLDSARADDLISDMAREFAPGLPSDEAHARGANLQDAGLTSIATVKLMLAIEAAYDIAIPDADLTPENFRSIGAIEALVARLRRA